MAYLEVETNEGVQRVSLERERLSIGRLSYNDVILPLPQISRQHAELHCFDGIWWIADLNSTNGLHLDGKRIKEHRLINGDQIVLAPNIAVRFIEEAAGSEPAVLSFPPAASTAESGKSATSSSASASNKVRRTAGFTASDVEEQHKTHPVSQPFPLSGQVYPPLVPPKPMVPEQPHSIYADDEVPFVPPGMAGPLPPLPTASSISDPGTVSTGHAMADSVGRIGGPPTIPFSSWNAAALSVSAPPRDNGTTQTSNDWKMTGDRYPAPPGPLQSGGDSHDPYRRSGPSTEGNGASGVVSGNLLHVCQTCGQLTSPDSVYCQNCHHSIAHECSNCRLSMLPIQERCPRCHTPNEDSVRRAHPGR